MAKETRNIPIVDSPYAGYDPIRGQLSLVLVANHGLFGYDKRGRNSYKVNKYGKIIFNRKLHTRAIGYK